MATDQPNYHAYLLRLWRVETQHTGAATWRASLEDPHTGLRLGFATLEQLFAYLMEVSEGVAPPATAGTAGEENQPPTD
ncbi:MAG: hypothetical protein DYG89_27930 [Caldilinea sp. CFX5]|nr:hypothetical protein [Caldilinea sp. CFX5]